MDRGRSLAMLEEAMVSYHRAYASLAGSAAHVEADCFWYESDIPFGVYGGVITQKFTTATADQRILELADALHNAGSGYGWLVMPTATPADLGQRLEAAGALKSIDLIGMAIDLADLAKPPPLPTGVEIVAAEDEASVAEYARLYPELFGAPTARWIEQVIAAEIEIFRTGRTDFHRYLALEHTYPVGAGMVANCGDFAVLETLLVTEAARNRGIGQVMATVALEKERQAGCKHAVLWAGPGADPLYRRMGFHEVATASGYDL